ncbi:MAG: flagellar protein FlaG [Bryobacterales bacterium]|nr:flagellar protein FlaG [Bryobacterales bacterium]
MDITALQGVAPTPAPVPFGAEHAAENREIVTAIKSINATELSGSNSELTFVFDRLSKRAVVRLIDKTTRNVIQQIPPEYMLRWAQEIAASEKGN